MKKDFFTGLALFLPIVITTLVVIFIIKLFTGPFMGTVSSLLNYYDILNKPILFLSGEQVLTLTSRLLITFSLFAIILLVGFLGKILFLDYFFKLPDIIFHRIPLINKIYKAVQEVVNTIFAKKETRFSEVVLVPFPHKSSRSIGLVTSQSCPGKSEKGFSDLVSVFVPGTPNPSMGFMLLYRREQLTPIDMKVPEAIKFLISCGVIIPSDNGKL